MTHMQVPCYLMSNFSSPFVHRERDRLCRSSLQVYSGQQSSFPLQVQEQNEHACNKGMSTHIHKVINNIQLCFLRGGLSITLGYFQHSLCGRVSTPKALLNVIHTMGLFFCNSLPSLIDQGHSFDVTSNISV